MNTLFDGNNRLRLQPGRFTDAPGRHIEAYIPLRMRVKTQAEGSSWRPPHYCKAQYPIRNFATGYHVWLCLLVLLVLSSPSLVIYVIIAHLLDCFKNQART